MIFNHSSTKTQKMNKNYPIYKTTFIDDMRSLVEEAAQNFPDSTAISYKENYWDKEVRKVTFTQWRNDVRNLGTALISKGLREEKIAIVGENSYGWCCSFFAVMAVMMFPVKAFSFISIAFIIFEILTFSRYDINIFSAFCIEKLIAGFNNVNIMSDVVLSIYPFFALLFISLILFSILFFVRTKKMYENAVAAATKAYYDDINDKYRQTRAMHHDMHNHLEALSALLDMDKIDEARKYLGEVVLNLNNVKATFKTDREVLDALIFKKQSEAK